jgi:squalene-associated FAD-dependent desaturase
VRVAVVGAGWAGLAAAVRATQAGHAVTLFETAGVPGGRARSDDDGQTAIDNGQHVLLGGYSRTLGLMREVGVDLEQGLLRLPLQLGYPDGSGFALSPHGPRLVAGLRALVGARGFNAIDTLSVVAMALDWQRRGFACPPEWTVAQLLRRWPTARVRRRLVEPLCVAALNTPIDQASAEVFLAVMRDSVFGECGAADLLVPQVPLARLLPLPALAWLRARGVQLRMRCRATDLARDGAGWRVAPTDDLFDRVILAAPPAEAARLAAPHAPAWAACAGALAHEAIVTIALRVPHRPWPAPMLALTGDATMSPAQFAFRFEGAVPGTDRVVLVASAAGAWLERGRDAVAHAAIAQCRAALGLAADEAVELESLRADRRATFRCAAGVARPPMAVAPGLLAAGDYVAGPYPATLEAAVQAGEAAAAALE